MGREGWAAAAMGAEGPWGEPVVQGPEALGREVKAWTVAMVAMVAARAQDWEAAVRGGLGMAAEVQMVLDWVERAKEGAGWGGLG